MTCCNENGCRRKLPIVIRRGGFTGRWFAVTRYTLHDGLLDASEKHDITDDLVAALLNEGWTPPPVLEDIA